MHLRPNVIRPSSTAQEKVTFSHVSAHGSGVLVARYGIREFSWVIWNVAGIWISATDLASSVESGHTRQPLWVAFGRTLASSAPSCPARAHEWCSVLGTVWRRTVPDVNGHMVSGILDWVTLLELSVGLLTITLLSAAFTEEDDNISFTFLTSGR